ncbi:hypothetical protein ACWPKO_08110 [Coraliomargarita sp. W4R53]
MLSKYILPLSVIAIASSTTAHAFSDNFNRADVTATSDGSAIGPNWVNGDSDNTWAITSNTAVLTPKNASGSANTTSVFYNTSFTQSAVDDASSTIQADVSVSGVGTWGGIAFNVQNSTDFYQFRFNAGASGYQLLKVSESDTVAGERQVSVLVSTSNASTTFAAGTSYTLSVTSTVSGTDNIIDFSITPVGGGTALNPTTTVTDSSSAYLGGYAGFTHANDTGAYTFDNFSAIPEASAYALLAGSLALGFVMVRRRRS